MIIRTSPFAYSVCRLFSFLARQPLSPVHVTVELTPDEFQIVRRRKRGSEVFQQETRLRLSDSLTFQVDGRFWQRLTIHDGYHPNSAPVIVERLSHFSVQRMLKLARLYQFNLHYQLCRRVGGAEEMSLLEERRRELLAWAALPQKVLSSDPVLQTLSKGHV